MSGFPVIEKALKIAAGTFDHCGRLGCCDFFGNLDEFEAIYERICEKEENARHFASCIDTGHSKHAARYGNPPQEAIHQLGIRTVCLHKHGNNGLTGQHKIPVTGTIGWDAVFDALDETGYGGSYDLDLHLGQFGPAYQWKQPPSPSG